jgi:hypothetical protein
MKRKQLFLVISSLVCAIIIFNPQTYVVSNSASPPSGKTGSVGDNGATCTGCHGGSAIPASGWVTSDVPIAGYASGNTYTINVIATHSTANKIGFEATVENGSGDKVGSLIVTDGARTGLVGMDYIGHVSAGIDTLFAGGNAWSFDWTAPSSGTGDVTFYAAINAANGDNGTSGDVIYTSSLTVQEDPGAPIGVKEDKRFLDVSLYPNPASVFLYVDLGQGWRNFSDIVVYDIKGAIVLSESGITDKVVYLNVESLKNGTYFVSSVSNISDGGYQKVIIQ